MTIQISDYTFEGPFASTSELKDLSGVYVILGKNGVSNWNVVDVGESEALRNLVANHDRQACWKGQNYPTLAAAALYTDARNRMLIENQLRLQYNPPCGVR